jgi:hypothetical protein
MRRVSRVEAADEQRRRCSTRAACAVRRRPPGLPSVLEHGALPQVHIADDQVLITYFDDDFDVTATLQPLTGTMRRLPFIDHAPPFADVDFDGTRMTWAVQPCAVLSVAIWDVNDPAGYPAEPGRVRATSGAASLGASQRQPRDNDPTRRWNATTTSTRLLLALGSWRVLGCQTWKASRTRPISRGLLSILRLRRPLNPVKENPLTALPEMLMPDTLWRFHESHPSLDAFYAAVLAYQKDILGHDGWSDEGVVLPSPVVTISYDHAQNDDWVERLVEFVADDPAGFTAAELLWKLNEDAVPRMTGQDHVFFEGLELVDSDSTPPRYSVVLGS